MQLIPYLNTCEKPLTPGTPLYPILIHADLPPPSGRVAHYNTTEKKCVFFGEAELTSVVIESYQVPRAAEASLYTVKTSS